MFGKGSKSMFQNWTKLSIKKHKKQSNCWFLIGRCLAEEGYLGEGHGCLMDSECDVMRSCIGGSYEHGIMGICMALDNWLSNIGDECFYDKECRNPMSCYQGDFDKRQIGSCYPPWFWQKTTCSGELTCSSVVHFFFQIIFHNFHFC